jgi:hypothetical protein
LANRVISFSGILAIIVFFALPVVKIMAGTSLPESSAEGSSTIQKVQTSQNGISDADKDSVITDKEVENAAKKLLSERMGKKSDLKTITAEKGSIYLVKLVSGKNLRAVRIQSDKDMVSITDSTGIVISLRKQEIAGITKVKVKDQKLN